MPCIRKIDANLPDRKGECVRNETCSGLIRLKRGEKRCVGLFKILEVNICVKGPKLQVAKICGMVRD